MRVTPYFQPHSWLWLDGSFLLFILNNPRERTLQAELGRVRRNWETEATYQEGYVENRGENPKPQSRSFDAPWGSGHYTRWTSEILLVNALGKISMGMPFCCCSTYSLFSVYLEYSDISSMRPIKILAKGPHNFSKKLEHFGKWAKGIIPISYHHIAKQSILHNYSSSIIRLYGKLQYLLALGTCFLTTL